MACSRKHVPPVAPAAGRRPMSAAMARAMVEWGASCFSGWVCSHTSHTGCANRTRAAGVEAWCPICALRARRLHVLGADSPYLPVRRYLAKHTSHCRHAAIFYLACCACGVLSLAGPCHSTGCVGQCLSSVHWRVAVAWDRHWWWSVKARLEGLR